MRSFLLIPLTPFTLHTLSLSPPPFQSIVCRRWNWNELGGSTDQAWTCTSIPSPITATKQGPPQRLGAFESSVSTSVSPPAPLLMQQVVAFGTDQKATFHSPFCTVVDAVNGSTSLGASTLELA